MHKKRLVILRIKACFDAARDSHHQNNYMYLVMKWFVSLHLSVETTFISLKSLLNVKMQVIFESDNVKRLLIINVKRLLIIFRKKSNHDNVITNGMIVVTLQIRNLRS